MRVASALILSVLGCGARELLLVGLYDSTNFTGDSADYTKSSLNAYALDGLSAPTFLSRSQVGLNPSWLTPGASAEHLFAISESEVYNGKNEGSVASLQLSCQGEARVSSRQGCGGGTPAHAAMVGGNIAVANYGSGNVAVLPVGSDGQVQPVKELLDYGNASHPHMISPFDSKVFVPTLGLDAVQQLSVPSLQPVGEVLSVPRRQGPRHLKFFPDGHGVLANEGAANVTCTVVFVRETEDGLAELETYETLPDHMSSKDMYPSEVILVQSKQGSYALVSIRDHSEQGRDGITVFKRHGERLQRLDYVHTGHYPRSMALTAFSDGKALLVVGNQFANSLTLLTFSVDGKLERFGKDVPVVDEQGVAQSPGFVGVFTAPSCKTVAV
jgi:6-phosphogluconolactonase (cycloisomerase 2 family)